MDDMNRVHPLKQFIHSQLYFLNLIYREHPKSIIAYAIISIITALSAPILVLLNKEIVDTISILNQNTTYLRVTIILLVGIFLIQYLSGMLDSILEYLFTRISYTVNYVMQRVMYSRLVQMPLVKFDDSQFFDNINLANSALSLNGIRVVSNVMGIISNLLSILGIIGILISIHWSLPIALLISTLPGMILIFIATNRKYKIDRDTSPLEREMFFTKELFMSKGPMKELKVFGLGNHMISKWSEIYKRIQGAKISLAWWESKWKSNALLILHLSSLGVSLLLVSQVYANDLSVGSYVALLGAVTSVQAAFSIIGSNLGSIVETAVYNNALLSIIHDQSDDQQAGDITIDSVDSISIENVSFSYPNSKKVVLDSISLTINKGEKICVVGSNGSGKTTLMNCLLGLYRADEGAIRVNGIDISRIHQESLLARISAVFQDFTRYKYTVRENIAFGDLSKMRDDAALHDLVRRIGLEDKVRSFPSKLDTFLTPELPEGADLSGGEWQKIALARGIIKSADVIVLDEPTSALDPITEVNFIELFHFLTKDKTTITISHRIGPTKFSDRIIVMDGGRIVEEGDFASLMQKKGKYYEMYHAQAKYYQE